MKKIIFTLIGLAYFCNAYSQDLIKEFQKLTLANDSLQRNVIKPLNDSILKLNSSNIIELNKFKEKLKTLENEKTDLESKNKNLETEIFNLNKNKLKTENDKLQIDVGTLTNKVKSLEDEIIKKDSEKIKEKEKGKKEVEDLIIKTYSKPFDSLIKNTSLNSVERDMFILGNKSSIQKTMLNLQIYFKAEQVLSRKYNKSQVEIVLKNIDSLEKTPIVKTLIENIENYSLFNNDLIPVIKKIVDLNNKDNMAENIPKLQKMKKKEILYEISEYCYNYYPYVNYPYLKDIIFEIITIKSKDADADISSYLDKL